MDYKAEYSLEKLGEYVGNNDEQIREMILLFIDTIPPDVLKLIEYAACGDFDNSYKTAHRIKPSFQVFDIQDAYDDLKEIEFIAKDANDTIGLTSRVSSLQLKVKAIVDKMKHDFFTS